jgi:ABC-type antimicrobial peptide transport system permease subunit
MEDQLAFTVAPYEVVALILGVFGGLALVIAFAGLYGLIAYQTAARTREIGIRMALGANPRDILALMLKEGLRLVLLGVAAGVPASVSVALLISKFLFGVAPLDPETYYCGACRHGHRRRNRNHPAGGPVHEYRTVGRSANHVARKEILKCDPQQPVCSSCSPCWPGRVRRSRSRTRWLAPGTTLPIQSFPRLC